MPSLTLTPRGHLLFTVTDDAVQPSAALSHTTQLSSQARAQHLSLGRALSEYAGAANKPRLLSLLLPVQRAAAECPWLKTMVDAGEIYPSLRWTPAEAFQLLNDVPRLEAAGVIVRVPTAWRANRPPRPQVTGAVGGKPPSGLGTDALLDFRMGVSLDGEPLSNAEIEQLLAASNGLHLVRGRWVEVDHERLSPHARRVPSGRDGRCKRRPLTSHVDRTALVRRLVREQEMGTQPCSSTTALLQWLPLR